MHATSHDGVTNHSSVDARSFECDRGTRGANMRQYDQETSITDSQEA